jgi:hypothetical protein
VVTPKFLSRSASPSPRQAFIIQLKTSVLGKQGPRYTVIKRLAIFPSPALMSLTKLSLAGNNLIIPGQGEFRKWQSGWGRENRTPFLKFSVF